MKHMKFYAIAALIVLGGVLVTWGIVNERNTRQQQDEAAGLGRLEDQTVKGLLFNLMLKDREPEEPEPEPGPAPVVSGDVGESSVTITWDPIDDPSFKGYKVVISQSNENPAYTGGEGCSGYLVYITNPQTVSTVVDNKKAYTNGDFGKYLEPGETYYFSVTALYKGYNVPGNAVSLTFPVVEVAPKPDPKPPAPKPPAPSPKVTARVSGDKIILEWQPVNDPKFKYYKIVISEKNANPAYPQDGYLHVISDMNKSSVAIDNKTKYINGDFGQFMEPGKKYYFSVTACYKDKPNEAWNAVRLTTPSTMHYEEPYAAPKLNAPVIGDDYIDLTWQDINDDRLKSFTVYMKHLDEDGKYKHYNLPGIDKAATSVRLDNQTNVFSFKDKDGSIEPYYLEAGKKYHFRVVAVYNKTSETSSWVHDVTAPANIYTP